MKILKTIIITLAGLGLIAVILNMIFGGQVIPFITEQTNGTIKYYVFDFDSYFQKINAQITNYEDLVLKLPTRQWTDDILNDLALILDYLIMIVNILCYPIRIGAYLGRILFTMLGADFTNQNMQWLIDFLNAGTSLNIPYI